MYVKVENLGMWVRAIFWITYILSHLDTVQC